MTRQIRQTMIGICVSAVLIEPSLVSAQATTPSAKSLAPPESAAIAMAPGTYEFSSVRTASWRPSPNAFSQIGPPLRYPGRPGPRPQRRSRPYSAVQRVLAGAALGIVGFYAGGSIALGVASECECGSGGSIWGGAFGGAAAGAAAGILLTR